MNDWMSGYQQRPNPLAAANPRRRTVEVICCPQCRSLSVAKSTRDPINRDVQWWKCADCGAKWKESAKIRALKARYEA